MHAAMVAHENIQTSSLLHSMHQSDEKATEIIIPPREPPRRPSLILLYPPSFLSMENR